ncbi:acyl-CoA dehydrogenase [Mycolicibacterium anyangense]|uniref:Acyl-CoA dehydrogenase n=1 Tax=Mycolicibacterium anyangense TaxID=1431246 RepID=A0A6N4W4Q1_9MYCO|nr:acyl-CoA dehydrogenase family protein [Mycolicibacterium anyangense]BBZ75518.1 acyl-CoA dehydrogenase [Mycolicibacterium anyangense]
MVLHLSADERADLAASVRAVCERMLTDDRLRAVAVDNEEPQRGFDAELWRALCEQIGVGAIALPEEYGGAGYGADALAAVAHELGRVLAPVPFISYVLTTGLLLDAAPPALLDDILEPLASGSRTATTILTADNGMWSAASVAISAGVAGDAWTVRGTARHVLHGAAADHFVVAAAVGSDIGLFFVQASDSEVHQRAEDTLDGTRPMATIEFTGAAAVRLGTGDAQPIIHRNVDRTLAVLAAEQVGALERVVDIAAEYARTRHQFGRPIGSFQAIKHKCADMLVDLEWSRSAAQAALDRVDAGSDEATWSASMAKAVCSEALRDATHTNIQIHGGIGFTWEDAAHLYLKRARTDEVLFGSPGAHFDVLATVAGVDAAALTQEATT